ncbi:WD40-repeat-containing domain protein [Podospora fimiseda]|uniref:WD40-repeat-containing domain protein n=1 Tax=Podospora fimiseda TaxID=252190 RepID=A0AAN7BXH1_9PEZI|nr:WD40-repeat-containing domain protein [Podospora fimiseda]
MYNLTGVDGYQYRFTPDDPIYVLDILPVATGLAATASDQTLSLFDPSSLNQGPLKTIKLDHGYGTVAKVYDSSESIICTTGENGNISVWDLRHEPLKAPAMKIQGPGIPLLSLATSFSTNSLAAGTELANHAASILIWYFPLSPICSLFTNNPRDLRHPTSPPKQTYSDLHSDDITELTFHPFQSHILLSGSTDGLINVSDTTITDEDEVVIQAFNHGSVHHAGFISDTEVYAASHDEKFALYDMDEQVVNKGGATLSLGDIREVVGCQYLADVVPKIDGKGAVIGAGSQDRELFQLIHLSKGPSGWGLDTETVVGLPGGHGQELVRSFVLFDEQQVVFTGGEDGCIKAWRPGS